MARVMGEVYSGRVLRFFGEALRQAGILIPVSYTHLTLPTTPYV